MSSLAGCLLFFNFDTYMLFTGWEVRIGRNCAEGLEYRPRPYHGMVLQYTLATRLSSCYLVLDSIRYNMKNDK